MVCLDQGRPVYPQDGLYAGCRIDGSLWQSRDVTGGGGRGLSQLGDDLKWSMSPSTNHHQRTETGQGKGQEVWSKAWQASTVDQSQRVSKMVAKIE